MSRSERCAHTAALGRRESGPPRTTAKSVLRDGKPLVTSSSLTLTSLARRSG
jgi:hypothetical protein